MPELQTTQTTPAREAGGKNPPEGAALSVYAYAQHDGWTRVKFAAQVCGEADDECFVEYIYYMPQRRAPRALEPGRAIRRHSDRAVEEWKRAVGQYVADVARIIEWAAEALGGEAGEALRRFEVRINVDPITFKILRVGLKAGNEVVALGPLPIQPAYCVCDMLYDTKYVGWGRPLDPASYIAIYNIVYTRMWKEALERLGCTVERLEGGDAKVTCNGKEAVFHRVLP